MKIKELAKKVKEKVTQKEVIVIAIIIVAFIICSFISIQVNAVKTQKEEAEEEYNELYSSYKQAKLSLTEMQENYNKLSKETKGYTDLTEDEKKIIDEKITEVKKATEEEKEKIKAEQEAEAKAKAEEEARAKAEAEAKAKAEKEAQEQAKREAEAHKYETGITWEDIARDGHTGEYCKFTGEVIQVINGASANQYRVKIDNNYDKIMLIEIGKSQIASNILEGDTISFKGTSYGNYTYTTVLGAKQTIPAVIVDEYSLN